MEDWIWIRTQILVAIHFDKGLVIILSNRAFAQDKVVEVDGWDDKSEDTDAATCSFKIEVVEYIH